MKTLMTAVVLTMALGVVAEVTPSAPAVAEEAKTDVIDLGSAASAESVKLKISGKAGDEHALIDIDCDDATLADILRQFRHAVGANIISSESSNLQQRVSVSLHQVPWLESLQSILNTRHFRLEPRGEHGLAQCERLLGSAFGGRLPAGAERVRVDGTKLEPGDRKDPVSDSLTVDTRLVNDRQSDREE